MEESMDPKEASEANDKGRFDFSPPLVFPALQEHKHTIILLHGRGSSADTFGPELLQHNLQTGISLREALPNAKFIFPSAAWNRARLYGKSLTRQWFDNWKLETPREKKELQINGLRQTTAYLHKLLQQEIDEMGDPNKVIIGGLSQGCAAALIATLLWQGPPLRAFVGMCGWLPFRHELLDAGTGDEEEKGGFSFGDEDDHRSPAAHAVNVLREMLDMDMGTEDAAGEHSEPVFQQIPFFLGHGTEDDRVYLPLGQEAASCFRALGAQVAFKEYQGLGHWYSGAMLSDLVGFLT